MGRAFSPVNTVAFSLEETVAFSLEETVAFSPEETGSLVPPGVWEQKEDGSEEPSLGLVVRVRN